MKALYVWATLKQAVGQTPLYLHRTTPIEDPSPLRYRFFALVKPPLQFSVSSLESSVSKLRPKKNSFTFILNYRSSPAGPRARLSVRY
jgi:hypothetical protein